MRAFAAVLVLAMTCVSGYFAVDALADDLPGITVTTPTVPLPPPPPPVTVVVSVPTPPAPPPPTLPPAPLPSPPAPALPRTGNGVSANGVVGASTGSAQGATGRGGSGPAGTSSASQVSTGTASTGSSARPQARSDPDPGPAPGEIELRAPRAALGGFAAYVFFSVLPGTPGLSPALPTFFFPEVAPSAPELATSVRTSSAHASTSKPEGGTLSATAQRPVPNQGDGSPDSPLRWLYVGTGALLAAVAALGLVALRRRRVTTAV